MAAAVRNTQLFAYLAGNFVSIIGTWAQRVVVFWLAWELTHSTAFLGTLAVLDLLPSVLTAPLAGALADRRPGRLLARNVQFLSAVPPLAMIGADWFDAINTTSLMLVTFAGGLLSGLDHPLRLLLVGSIVPREQVAKAVAANSVVFNIGRMIGPTLGGGVVYLGQPSLVFAYNAVSYLLFAAILAFLTIPNERQKHSRASPPPKAVGWVAVARAFDTPLILAAVQFSAIAVLIRPVFELLPSFSDVLAQDYIEASQVFSLLTSAQGAGAIVGAVATSQVMRVVPYQTAGLAAGFLATGATLVFLASYNFGVSIVFLAIMAGAVLANGITTQVALQTTLPEQVRGRALSLYTMVMRGMPAAGALLVGTLAEFLPLRPLGAALALVMFGVSVWVFVKTRK